jgi:hypothetical protein
MRRRPRFLRFAYLLAVAAGAYALWKLIPPDVKKVVYETYINPP